MDPMPERYSSAVESNRNVLLVAYVLYGLSFFIGVSAIAAVIINHVKINDSSDLIARSHHRWLLRTFWFALLWTLVSLVLTIVVVGALGFVLVWLWCLYRIVRGVIAFAERKPMPMPDHGPEHS